jgi:hypothetical protein
VQAVVAVEVQLKQLLAQPYFKNKNPTCANIAQSQEARIASRLARGALQNRGSRGAAVGRDQGVARGTRGACIRAARRARCAPTEAGLAAAGAQKEARVAARAGGTGRRSAARTIRRTGRANVA